MRLVVLLFLLPIFYLLFFILSPHKLNYMERKDGVVWIDDSLSVRSVFSPEALKKDLEVKGYTVKFFEFPWQIDYSKALAVLSDFIGSEWKNYELYSDKFYLLDLNEDKKYLKKMVGKVLDNSFSSGDGGFFSVEFPRRVRAFQTFEVELKLKNAKTTPELTLNFYKNDSPALRVEYSLLKEKLAIDKYILHLNFKKEGLWKIEVGLWPKVKDLFTYNNALELIISCHKRNDTLLVVEPSPQIARLVRLVRKFRNFDVVSPFELSENSLTGRKVIIWLGSLELPRYKQIYDEKVKNSSALGVSNFQVLNLTNLREDEAVFRLIRNIDKLKGEALRTEFKDGILSLSCGTGEITIEEMPNDYFAGKDVGYPMDVIKKVKLESNFNFREKKPILLRGPLLDYHILLKKLRLSLPLLVIFKSGSLLQKKVVLGFEPLDEFGKRYLEKLKIFRIDEFSPGTKIEWWGGSWRWYYALPLVFYLLFYWYYRLKLIQK